ncbi:MAG: NUDIX hydrolase [Pseudohongiellaceae bacterium]|nr:NUDIX hydrolase [Pseudohongiellaceae bacterium]
MLGQRDSGGSMYIEPKPASTVVILREGDSTLEVLLLLRNSTLSFKGGHWVFPGGKVDPDDYPDEAGQEHYLAACNAVIRETEEEAGIDISTERLQHISHWTTPEGGPKRYATWFFVCQLSQQVDITVDNDEILDHCWMSPEQALAACEAGELKLPVPTLKTLRRLAPIDDFAALEQHLSESEVYLFPPESPFYPSHCVPR